jgi:hypothetical protein
MRDRPAMIRVRSVCLGASAHALQTLTAGDSQSSVFFLAGGVKLVAGIALMLRQRASDGFFSRGFGECCRFTGG